MTTKPIWLQLADRLGDKLFDEGWSRKTSSGQVLRYMEFEPVDIGDCHDRVHFACRVCNRISKLKHMTNPTKSE